MASSITNINEGLNNPDTGTTPSNISTLDPNDCNNTLGINQQFFGCDNNAVKDLLESIANDITDQNGIEINYWRHNFDIQKAHPLWGTQCDAEYIGPYCIRAYVNVFEDISFITQPGLDSDIPVDLEISYEEWAKISTTDSPLATDVFEIKGLLCERPSGFDRVFFKVFSQGDGDLFTATPRWIIKGNRDTFTWFTGQPRENGDNQPFTEEFIGPVDEFDQPLSSAEQNVLEYTIDELAREDFDNSFENKDEEFGGFYS